MTSFKYDGMKIVESLQNYTHLMKGLRIQIKMNEDMLLAIKLGNESKGG